MNRYLIPVLSVLLSLGVVCHAAEPAGGGISFPLTRVVYPESEAGGISFTLTNNTENLYLLQSRVIPAERETADSGKVPFIVIPPLTRFEPGSSVTLLIRRSGSVAETDRELLWRLALKTIPARPDTVNGGEALGASVVLALQNNFRLFYRPDGLAELNAEARAEQLQFALRDGYLTVTNPTPYYITLSELTADGKTVVKMEGQRMIPPHGSVRYPAEPAVSVSWAVSGDDGRQTGQHQRSLR